MFVDVRLFFCWLQITISSLVNWICYMFVETHKTYFLNWWTVSASFFDILCSLKLVQLTNKKNNKIQTSIPKCTKTLQTKYSTRLSAIQVCSHKFSYVIVCSELCLLWTILVTNLMLQMLCTKSSPDSRDSLLRLVNINDLISFFFLFESNWKVDFF